MGIFLTEEQSTALHTAVERRITVVDQSTNRMYVIVEADFLAKLESINAIRVGLTQMAVGEGQPVSEAINEIRENLRRRA